MCPCSSEPLFFQKEKAIGFKRNFCLSAYFIWRMGREIGRATDLVSLKPESKLLTSRSPVRVRSGALGAVAQPGT